MRIKRSNHSQAPVDIKNRETFKCNSMSGKRVMGLTPSDAGQLRGDDLAAFERDRGNITYVVLSYDTPIWWETANGDTHRVDQKFSVTTSKHQSRLYLV